jgi:protein-L-isoaspartate(D-aspartate) O-methyltransferase
MTDFAVARQRMVLSQLHPDRVTDSRVRDAMSAVPRERFVPDALRGVAYLDEDIEIAQGRYLMEPRVFARLLQAAAFDAGDIVLDVGCGTGYSTAVLARLAATVVALEPDDELRARATGNLEALGVDNAVVVNGALPGGYAAEAPYDVILVNGGVERLPGGLVGQLSPGGRLLYVDMSTGVGRATLYRRVDGTGSPRVLFDAQVPMLAAFKSEAGFVF